MTDIEHEIEKIKYHINIIGETINDRNNPITALVVLLDWNKKDLDAAYDIFEKYDKQLGSEEEVSWAALEKELRERFRIDHQTVRSIILAFYRNNEWTEICILYAEAYECDEFNEIY